MKNFSKNIKLLYESLFNNDDTDEILNTDSILDDYMNYDFIINSVREYLKQLYKDNINYNKYIDNSNNTIVTFGYTYTKNINNIDDKLVNIIISDFNIIEEIHVYSLLQDHKREADGLNDSDLYSLEFCNKLYNKYKVIVKSVIYHARYNEPVTYKEFTLLQTDDKSNIVNNNVSVIKTDFCKYIPKFYYYEIGNDISNVYKLSNMDFESENTLIEFCKQVFRNTTWLYGDTIYINIGTVRINGHFLYENEKYFSNDFYKLILSCKTKSGGGFYEWRGITKTIIEKYDKILRNKNKVI